MATHVNDRQGLAFSAHERRLKTSKWRIQKFSSVDDAAEAGSERGWTRP